MGTITTLVYPANYSAFKPTPIPYKGMPG